jgi:hypothetical protein
MEDTYRVQPHILRRILDDEREEVVEISVDGPRALLLFPSRPDASTFNKRMRAGVEPTSVSPAEISEVCANHSLALVALYGFQEPEHVDVVSVEVLEDLFE